MRSILFAVTALAGALSGAAFTGCSNSDDGCDGGECASDGGESGTPIAGTGGNDAGGRGGGGRGGTSPGGAASGAAGDGGGEGGAPSTGGTSSGGAGGEGTSGGGGEDGAGAGGQGPRGCDREGSPSVETCLVAERFAVFVAPQGDDVADGTRATPFRTIARAVERARESGRLVIACSGTFDERISLRDGARIYGGFACPDSATKTPWTYDARTKTIVAPSARGVALEARDVAKAIVIEDLELSALDATEPGESSVGASMVRAADVTLRRVRILAGSGRRGADGTRSGFVYPTALELRGRDGAAEAGGASEPCSVCPGTVRSRPGRGGDRPGEGGGEGQPIYDDSEEESQHEGGGGIATFACTAGGAGLRGAQGFFGSAAVGAIAFGSLTDAGWLPAPGIEAPDGFPGQGGGGGAGKPGGGGGSGGCGGCGGKGGGGGRGGGASIGLAALDSVITIEHSEIRSARAGDGGSGAPGQVGQGPGGAGGIGFGSNGDRGCNGGFGGPGGDGGPGGGGAGGISVGILFSGQAPVVDDENAITPGVPGASGLGGGTRGENGVEGVARATLRIE